jgi:hypothetical protein
MAEFGKFTELTFVNGTTPAINADNLNELERVIALTDEELSRSQTICFSDYAELLYNNNTKTIEDFEDEAEWTNAYSSTCTLSNSSYYNTIGPNAVVVTEDDDTGGFIGMYKTISSIDLTEFNDGSASSIDDCIVFLFYIENSSLLTNIQFRIGTDFSNSYLISFTGLANGWNVRYPQKSDFTTNGSPAGWDDITYLRCVGYTQNTASGVFVSFQYIQLLRHDPLYSGYANFSQLEQDIGYGNMFDIYHDTWTIIRDISPNLNRFGFMYLDTQDYNDALSVYEDCINFIAKIEMYPKHAGVTNSIAWFVDANNFCELYIQSHVLTLRTYKAGVLESTATDILTSNLDKNERIFLYFEKRGQNFKGYAKKGGERLRYVNLVTTISADTAGDIRVGGVAQYSQSLITDITVSSNPGSLRLENDGNFEVIKKTEVQEFDNNTLEDVDDMKVKLKPNSVYQITAYLSANNDTSATPDIKTSWDLTGDGASQLTTRHGVGPALSMTDNENCNSVLKIANLAATISYGIEGTGSASSIRETFLVKTEQDGGELQLQAAQNTTDGSNPSTLSENCFMLVQKCC